MLSEVFYWLLNMSLAASLAGAVVLLLRAVKKIPRRVIALAWAFPFLRMWIPVGIGGRYGLMTLFARLFAKSVRVPDFFELSMMNSVGAAESYFPIVYKTKLLARVFAVSSLVWAILAAALLIALAVLYFTTMKETKSARRLRDNVYVSETVTSPAAYGVLRPKILIPASWENREFLPLYLLHERKHLRRKDNLWRILAFLTAAIHWFNPLTWLFLRCFLNDLELACDESVLASCPEDDKKRYALALVAGAESKTLFVSAFGGARIRTRVERVLSFKKMSVVSAVAFAGLLAAVAYVLLTNAA